MAKQLVSEIKMNRNKYLEELNTDSIVPPWEQEREANTQKRLEKLKTRFAEREAKTLQREEKIKTLTKQKTSSKESIELKKKVESIKKLFALDYWMRSFNRVSYCNEISGQALFHVCLGQALNTFKIYLEDDSAIDWRLHYLLIQQSSSGKGRALSFVNKVFKHPKFLKVDFYNRSISPIKRKYEVHKLGRMNPASLINTFKFDKKKGEILKDKNGIEILKKGILSSNDFIYSEECRDILESRQESLEKQEILMTAMETIGSTNNIYNKQLMDYEKKCESRFTCSFALTTRPFGKMKQTLMESGLIQRMIFYPRIISFEERDTMNEYSSFAVRTKDKTTNFEYNFNLLIDELNKIVNFASNNIIDFHEDRIDDLLSFLLEKIKWFTHDVNNKVSSSSNREILQSFIGRYKDNILVMAFHSAVIRYSKYVEKQDLQYAFDFFKKLYEAQKTWISLTLEEDKEVKSEDMGLKHAIKQFIKEDKNQVKYLPDLTKHLAREFNKDYLAIRYHLIKFTKGQYPFIRLVDTDNQRKKRVELVVEDKI